MSISFTHEFHEAEKSRVSKKSLCTVERISRAQNTLCKDTRIVTMSLIKAYYMRKNVINIKGKMMQSVTISILHKWIDQAKVMTYFLWYHAEHYIELLMLIKISDLGKLYKDFLIKPLKSAHQTTSSFDISLLINTLKQSVVLSCKFTTLSTSFCMYLRQ